MSPSRPAPGPIALVVVALVLCLATPAVAAPTIVARYDFFRGLEVAQVVLPEAETTLSLLVLPAGGADDPAGMEGLASVTASMLLLGSRSDAWSISERPPAGVISMWCSSRWRVGGKSEPFRM